MDKSELKNILETAACGGDDNVRLNELSEEVKILKNSSVFSKVSISVEKMQLKCDGSKKIVVTIKERLTDIEFKLSLGSVMKMSVDLKVQLNVNGVLYETDFVAIQNVALTLAELCTDAIMVDSFPVLDYEGSCNSYKALYDALIEDFVSGAEYVTAVPNKFIDKDNGYIGLYCKDFEEVGRNVVLMRTEALMQALEICDKNSFISVMRHWRDNGLLCLRESSKRTERLQVKHRITGTDTYLWYAVVIPQNTNLDTVVTVDTVIS